MVERLPAVVTCYAPELQGIRRDMRKYKAAEIPGELFAEEPPPHVTRGTEINDRGKIGAPRLELAVPRYSARYEFKGREI